MKTRAKKIAAILGAAVLVMGTLAGCGDTNETTTTPSSTAENTTTESSTTESNTTESSAEDVTADLSGTITLSGSTSMEKLANALCESFMEKYPNVTATAEFTGSGAGIEAVLAGTCDIGNSSRNLKDEEKANGAVENIVAIDGIAVVVDPANTVTGLTKDQLTSIYTGEVTNWSEVGGADAPIVVVGREAGSGTRGAFEEILKVEDACAYANELDSTGAVMAKVATTPGAIGYVSLDVVDDSVIALALDGVEATAENIKAGNYFLSRPFVMATKGEISEQSELVQAWFDYVLGEEGQEIAAEVGLITVQ
ncbi:MAG: phosphate ABC transporter substrate-binding protein [Lachnospiraceae bacterium]